jgi:hypothetical protein
VNGTPPLLLARGRSIFLSWRCRSRSTICSPPGHSVLLLALIEDDGLMAMLGWLLTAVTAVWTVFLWSSAAPRSWPPGPGTLLFD